MECMKVNTLNENATHLFHQNLVNEQILFKQLGTAFIIPENTASFHPNSFNGLWIGHDANIELEELSAFDKSQELYVHS